MRGSLSIPRRRRGGASWFVAVPPGQASEERATKVAAATSSTVYDARQLLLRPAPSLRAFADEAAARAWQSAIAGAGVRAVCYPKARVDAVPDATPVRSVSIAEPAADPYRASASSLAIDLGAGAARLPLASVGLAVVGELRETELQRRTKPKVIVDARGRFVQVEMADQEIEREESDWLVIDLHREGAAPLRLLEREVEVRAPGLARYERRAAFLHLRRWLERAPGAPPVDDGFAAVGVDDVARVRADELSRHGNAAAWDDYSAHRWVIETLLRETHA